MTEGPVPTPDLTPTLLLDRRGTERGLDTAHALSEGYSVTTAECEHDWSHSLKSADYKKKGTEQV